MNSKTFGINKMHKTESEGRFGGQIQSPVKSGGCAERWLQPKIQQTRRSKTIQASGTEKVLAQYPDNQWIEMGELVVSKNQHKRKVKQGHSSQRTM